MEKKLRILILDDVQADAELVEHALRKARIASTVRHVASRGAFLEQIKEFSPDVILSDYAMPHFDGMAALRMAQEHIPQVPFIVVTGSMNEETAADCIKAGATDYVTKEHLVRLGPAVTAALEKQRLRLEKEHADAKLRENEERYRSITESLGDAVITIDEESRIIHFANSSAEKIFGYSISEMTGREVTMLMSEHYRDRHRGAVKKYAETGVPHLDWKSAHFPGLHKNGKEIPLEISYSEFVLGNKRFFTAVVKDIRERVEAQEKLRESEERYRSLYENSTIGIYRTTPDGRIIMANPALVKMLGYSSFAELSARNLAKEGFEPSHQRKEFLEQIEMESEVKGLESAWICREGKEIFVRESARAFRDEKGNSLYYDGTVEDITERKRAEEGLKLFRTLIDRSNDAIEVVDPESGRFLDVNEKACIDSGYSRQEFLALRVFDIDPTVDQPSFTKVGEELRKSGTMLWEGVHRRKDGSAFPVEINMKYVQLDRDYIVTVVRDITERKKAEKQIGMLAHAVKSISECVSITDMEDKLLFVNEAFLKTYSYDEHELLGKHIGIVRSPNNLPEVVRDILPATLRGGWHGELMNRRKNGSDFPISLSTSVIRDDRWQPIALIGVAADITEQKHGQEALMESEQHYRRFFEEDLSGIYISTPEGKLQTCNLSFARILGYETVEEILRADISTFYPTPELRDLFLRRLKQERRLLNYGSELRHPSGRPIFAVENVIGRFNEKGDLVSIQGYLVDETERRLLEQQLLQSQKLESLGTLASGIAHDFNNILGIIVAHSSILAKIVANPDRLTQSIDAIIKAGMRGASLVQQLLTFARKSESALESLGINDIVGDILKLLSETFPKSITVTTTLGEHIPNIQADSTQLHQVLLNLCVNARDAMPKGGALAITTSTVEGVSLARKFPDAAARTYVEVEVSDSGTGMTEEIVQRIFEPFFTTKGVGKGTGLGLALVYSIIKNHSGYVDVESTVGVGTTFCLYIPVELGELLAPAPAVKLESPVVGGTETILLIEDEEMLREFMKSEFIANGYTVLSAADGEEGVEVFSREHEKISLVLSDLGLPKLGGLEVFEQIRAIDPNVRYVVASGFIDPASKSQMFRKGVLQFVQKPYDPENVMRIVREILDLKK